MCGPGAVWVGDGDPGGCGEILPGVRPVKERQKCPMSWAGAARLVGPLYKIFFRVSNFAEGSGTVRPSSKPSAFLLGTPPLLEAV